VAETVVRFAKARVVCAANELGDRIAVAVGAVEIATAVPAKAEGIYLSPSEDFDMRSVREEAEANRAGKAGMALFPQT
jgi:hypothetical protein